MFSAVRRRTSGRVTTMGQVITAMFDEGVLKPDQPLSLPPRTRVRLIVEPLSDSPEVHREKIRQEVEQAWADPARDAAWEELEKLWDEVTVDSGGPRPTRDELHDRH